ncbi:unnamed protein product [Spodoptera exigua]|nr:unnamed protein product [Spodoptera exigua]
MGPRLWWSIGSGLVLDWRRATLTSRPQTGAYGGRRSFLVPQRPECHLLRRLGREEDSSLTRSASSFPSITASQEKEAASQFLLFDYGHRHMYDNKLFGPIYLHRPLNNSLVFIIIIIRQSTARVQELQN